MIAFTFQTKPAILGGPPAVTLEDSGACRWPLITAREEQAVLEVLRSGDLSLHPVTRRLEDDYRRLLGRRYALAHCNGTAALLAAFFALDLQPGDEVLVPSATFWASVVPMLWLGALPVFCDIEGDRLGLDPTDVERKITERTRAMVVVHLWGMPAKMTELTEICRRHGLRIIEDASHAHGASWRHRPCGTLGDLSVFSLQSSKLAPAGEGGMLLTDDEVLHERSVCLGDMMRILELPGEARSLAGTTFGIKTRMACLSAAVGRVQLGRLEELNRRRNGNIRYLSRALERLGFDTFSGPSHVERVYFEFIVRPPTAIPLSRSQLVAALQAEGCRVEAPRYPLLHQQPLFAAGLFRRIARLPQGITPPDYRQLTLPRTEYESEYLLRLPTFPSADRPLLDQYVRAIEKVLGRGEEIAERLSPTPSTLSGSEEQEHVDEYAERP